MTISDRMDPAAAGVLARGRWLWLRALAWMLALGVGAGLIANVQSLINLSLHRPVVITLPGAATGLLLAYLFYVAAVLFGEKRRPVEIAPAAMPLELVAGLAIGVALMALTCASLLLIGAYGSTLGHLANWPRAVAANALTALFEELLFRAIVFRLLMRAFGAWPALMASALIFGGVHLLNPSATLMAAVAIAVEAGLMLAAFYLFTGRIWVSVGVHAGWNFAQGSVFGAHVSGYTRADTLFASTPRPGVPDILSGGAFGPEASLPAMLLGLAVFLIVILAAYRRGGAVGR